jgi:hypothetical protein
MVDMRALLVEYIINIKQGKWVMTQKVLSFAISVPSSDYSNISMRYTRSRVIINRLRQYVGTAIHDLDDSSYAYALGKDTSGPLIKEAKPSIQNASEISKWNIDWADEKDTPEILEGVLTLVLEKNVQDSKVLNHLIVQAGGLVGIKIISTGIRECEIDYSVDDTNHIYRISNFYPGMSKHWTDDERRERTPTSTLPHDAIALSKTIGKFIKKHIIETAQFQGMDTDEIESSPFFVKAKWVACPVRGANNIREDLWHASIAATFSVPFSLEGYWFAGGLRHLNSGLITVATETERLQLKTGGAFVL